VALKIHPAPSEKFSAENPDPFSIDETVPVLKTPHTSHESIKSPR
jgi:hypothetical protein